MTLPDAQRDHVRQLLIRNYSGDLPVDLLWSRAANHTCRALAAAHAAGVVTLDQIDGLADFDQANELLGRLVARLEFQQTMIETAVLLDDPELLPMGA